MKDKRILELEEVRKILQEVHNDLLNGIVTYHVFANRLVEEAISVIALQDSFGDEES